MRSIKNTFLIFVLFIVYAFGLSVQAQTPPDPCLPLTQTPEFDFSTWMNCRVRDVVAAKINQRGVNKQVQTPSIAESSTSLVDQTEAPDLVGLALNFAGLNTGSDDSSKNANYFTTSAIAVYADAT